MWLSCLVSKYRFNIPPMDMIVFQSHPNRSVPMKILLTAENLDQINCKEKHDIATKLHRQFGHPLESKKLRDLCLEVGINDQELFKQTD